MVWAWKGGKSPAYSPPAVRSHSKQLTVRRPDQVLDTEIRIDVQRTDDDHVVVVHDRDLMRVGNEPAVITEASYAGLAKVDIGSWFGASFADQRLPTLEQVLVRCKKAIKVNIELKYYNWDDRLAHRVIEIVEESGTENDIVVMSLQPEAVRQVKSLRPGWQVGLLSAAALTLSIDFSKF